MRRPCSVARSTLLRLSPHPPTTRQRAREKHHAANLLNMRGIVAQKYRRLKSRFCPTALSLTVPSCRNEHVDHDSYNQDDRYNVTRLL